jgi:rubredoxin
LSTFQPFMQALLWTCKSCGFVYEGGQPKQNCPFCEAYKTNFIDLPQHLEATVREAHPDKPFNHAECRTMRLELMQESGAQSSFRVAGRVLPTVSGRNIANSNLA